MIELGYKKLYCPYAGVYHSHNYELETYKQRFYDEYKGIYTIHQYVMVKDIPHLLVGYYRFVKNNLNYVNSLDMDQLKRKNGVNIRLKEIGIDSILHIWLESIIVVQNRNKRKWIKSFLSS